MGGHAYRVPAIPDADRVLIAVVEFWPTTFGLLFDLDPFDLRSSAGARELLTRLDAGQRCSTSLAAGLSNAGPASLSQDAKSLESRTTGVRSCISATKSFGSVMSIVQDLSVSPVVLSFHSSHSPANVIGSPSARVKYQGCLPLAVS